MELRAIWEEFPMQLVGNGTGIRDIDIKGSGEAPREALNWFRIELEGFGLKLACNLEWDQKKY